MTRRFSLLIIILLALFTVPALRSPAAAQIVSADYNRWDAQVTVTGATDPLKVSEQQEIRVISGPLHFATRTWTRPVQIQNVYYIGSDNTPRNLTQGTNAGAYQVTTANGGTSIRVNLPSQANSGDSFTIQINYTADSPASGIVDWPVVPTDHAGVIRSSTLQVKFPNGQAPDSSLARVTSGSGAATLSGNTLTVRSNGTIPLGQEFRVQVPFGAGVGAANTNNTNNGNTNPGAVNPVPVDPNAGIAPTDPNAGSISLPGGGSILLIVCIGGIILLFVLLLGGGSLIRRLLGGGVSNAIGGGIAGNVLGGLLGGGRGRGGSSGGGMFGGGGGNIGGSSNPFSGSGNPPTDNSGGGGRGFRPSGGSQERELPPINNDKGSSGGSSFG